MLQVVTQLFVITSIFKQTFTHIIYEFEKKSLHIFCCLHLFLMIE